MSITALVVDTSYLLELYRVPGKHEPAFSERVRERFRGAIDASHRLFVPFAVVFEVANHIARVRDWPSRRGLAEQLARVVRASVEEGTPWVMTPANEDILTALTALLALLDRYADEWVRHGIGLSDAAILELARRLKAKYNQPGDRVHIWTRDQALKAREPDTEPEPLA